MTCTVTARRACERVAAACDSRDVVLFVDVLSPVQSPDSRWTVELTLAGSAGGVPPAVSRALADHGLTLRELAPQGGGAWYRAVAALR